MKRLIWIFVFFAAISTALTASALEAEISKLSGICDDSGNIKLSGIHRGRTLRTNDIAIVATHNATNKSENVVGYWEIYGENTSYLWGSSVDSANRFYFYSTNSPFSKNGRYIIKLSFLALPTDYFPVNVFLAVDCLGKTCNSDSQCNLDEYCNNATAIGRCTYLICKEDEIIDFNRCVPKCNDKNPCTKDIYNNGLCVYKKIEDCCRVNSDCSDGLACTTERCVDNKCVFSPLKCEAAKGSCIISNCIEPRGCVYETNESCISLENQKRQYMIVIGEPKIEKKPFFSKIAEWFRNVFSNFF